MIVWVEKKNVEYAQGTNLCMIDHLVNSFYATTVGRWGL